MSTLSPHCSELSLFIEPPYASNAVGNRVAKDQSGLRLHVLVTGSEHNLVGFEFRAVGKAEAVRQDFGNFLTLLDLDMAIDYGLTCAV